MMARAIGLKILLEVTNNGVDRISNLPDEILCHIISFIPNKDAIGTTILSRRWKNLWPFATPFRFDDIVFYDNWRFADHRLSFKNWGFAENGEVIRPYFINFVNKVLSLRENDEYIKEFNLNLQQCYDNSLISSWICWALCRNIQYLDVCFDPFPTDPPGPIILSPPCVFDCRQLITLKLTGNFLIDPQNSVISFPNLKYIQLFSVTFGDEVYASNFLSSSPVLEEIVIGNLIITRGSSEGTRDLCIFAPKLRRLEVCCYGYVKNCSYNFRVRAPSLVYLGVKMDQYMNSNIVIESCPSSIVEAEIDGDMRGAIKIRELLGVISHVKQLSLLFYNLKMQSFDLNLPMFHSLTTLKLRVDPHVQRLLSQTLESAPNLKDFILIIAECFDGNHSPEDHCRLPSSVPHCVLACLEYIEIKCGDQMMDLIDIFKDFLKYAKVLKKMKVTRISMREMREPRVLEELLRLPRASNACQIQLIDKSTHCLPFPYDE